MNESSTQHGYSYDKLDTCNDYRSNYVLISVAYVAVDLCALIK